MFCTKCGNKIPDGSVFCDECGTKIEMTPPQPAPQVSPQASPAQPAVKRTPNKVIALCVVAAVIVVAAILLIKNMKPTIELNDYLKVSFDGYDTRGVAEVSFDMDSFIAAYEDKIEYKGILDDEVRSFLKNGGSFSEYLCDECISGSLNQYDMLSTGDTITYTWNCNDALAELNYNVKLSYEDIEITVEGLKPVIEVDPFEDIEIKYYGVAPYGLVDTITNHSSKEYLKNLYYDCDSTDYLDNGDEITIRVEGYNEETFLENYGVVFTKLESTCVIEGLGSYVTALDDISSDVIEAMQQQTIDVMHAFAANKWAQEEVLDDMEYLGSYLLTPKIKKEYGDQNQLILVYKITVREMLPEYGIDQKFNYYYTTTFYNLIALPDGDVSVDLTNYSTTSDRFTRKLIYGEDYYDYNNYYYNGYETLEMLFNKEVTAKIDRFNYESDIKE